MGTYNGQQTLSARNAQASDLASAGKALLSAGILPSSEQAEAMGYTIPQLQLMLAQNQAGQSAGASGGGGSYSSGTSGSSGSGAEWGRGIGQLAMENTKKLISRHLGNGNAARAEEVMDAVSPNMTREEYNEIVKIYKNNGYPMEYAGR